MNNGYDVTDMVRTNAIFIYLGHSVLTDYYQILEFVVFFIPPNEVHSIASITAIIDHTHSTLLLIGKSIISTIFSLTIDDHK